MSWNSSRSVILLFLFTLFLFEMCTFFHVCFFICSSLKWLTGRPRAICGQRYPLPCFAWLWIGMRGSKEVALIGMKSCRTQGDVCLFVVCLSIHQSPPGPLRPEICHLMPEIYSPRPEIIPPRHRISPLRHHISAKDERTDKRTSPCVLQDFIPFRATVLLPLTTIYNHAKQGNG